MQFLQITNTPCEFSLKNTTFVENTDKLAVFDSLKQLWHIL